MRAAIGGIAKANKIVLTSQLQERIFQIPYLFLRGFASKPECGCPWINRQFTVGEPEQRVLQIEGDEWLVNKSVRSASFPRPSAQVVVSACR
jgi:hypothetical protein